MFSNLLDSIKGEIGSKGYWLGGMLPGLLVAAVNIGLLQRHYPAKVGWLTDVIKGETTAPSYALFAILALSGAYLLTAISSLLLEWLEGKSGPILWLSPGLMFSQQSTLGRLERRYQETHLDLVQFDIHAKNWETALHEARSVTGQRIQRAGLDWVRMLWRSRILSVWWRHRCGRLIHATLLGRAVDGVCEVFRGSAPGPAAPVRFLSTERIHASLVDAISYAIDRARFEHLRLDARRQLNFPGLRGSHQDAAVPSSNKILAPTQFGNIARTMRSYALTRYQLDLDIFWTRLQNALQRDGKEYYEILQGSRAMVDCLVALVWLTGATTLVWTLALIARIPGATRFELIVIGVGGAVLTLVFYELACRSYRVFADVLRSSVDLFRFNLLTSLHLPLPADASAERDQWLKLGQLVGFADEQSIVYKHPQ